ncbi:HSP70/90 co-chaperone [Saitoella coloradoensis]
MSKLSWEDSVLNNPAGPGLPETLSQLTPENREEFYASMNRIPLFMTQLTDDAQEDNPHLEALKALAYEGDPDEVATNFRQQGNEAFREKRWRDAVEFYTKALQMKCGVNEIDEACYANRAASNLELQNYRKVLADTSACLKLNPKNVKALYRAARALLALDKLHEAQDALDHAISLDPSNASLKIFKVSLEKRKTAVKEKQESENRRKAAEEAKKQAFATAVAARNYTLTTTPNPPDMADAQIHLTDPTDPASILNFPTLLLYPLHAQTDFIAALPETSTIADVLDTVLTTPAEWDTSREYTPRGVECYVQTTGDNGAGLMKVGRKLGLWEILGSGKVEVQDQCFRIMAVPKGKSEVWIKDFKEKVGKAP